MSAKQKISRVLLTLMLVLASVPWGANVSAQEEAVNVVFKVFLQLEGQEANAQGQISYDVLTADKSEFLYQYRSQEPPAESLRLAEGNYYFRLYDGGGFVREGVEIMPEKVLQTISNQTEEDKAEGKTKRELDEIGAVLTQGDGTKVYDVPFSVFAGPTLVNGDTVEIELHLADQATITANQQDDGGESSEPVAPTLSTVTFTMLDDNQSPIPNVTIQMGDLQATSGENGLATFNDVAAGDYMISIASLPEGYTGSLEDLITVESEDQTITLNIQTAAAAVGSVLFTVLDQNSTAVPGVGILIGETELVTSETGEASISDLPAADYTYTVTSLPEGYSADVSDVVTIVGDQQVAPVIYITKNEPQVGSARFEVRDQNDAAFANVVITIEGQEVTTNENGVVVVSDLPVGTLNYTVAGTAAYSKTYGEVTVATEGEVVEPVVVNRIPQNGTASFTVTDGNGAPVTGVVINISDQQVTTNEEGRGSLDLPFGDYEYSLAALPDGYSGEATGLVTVTAEGVNTPISVTKAAETGSVRFEVTDQNDAAAATVVIQIAEQVVTTNENGAVVVADLPVGTLNYTVSATETFAETYGEVTVAEGEVVETFRVNRIPTTGVASFMVNDQSGAPLEGVVINLTEQQITTNAEGIASLADLAVGDYSYSIASLPDGYVGEASGTVTVTAEASELVEIAVEKAAVVGSASIKVIDQNEAVVAGAVVTIAEQALTTNAEGVATISDLLVGDYTYTLTSVPEGYSGEGTGTLTVTDAETATATISVTKAAVVGSASIKVIDQNEAMVAGAVITLNEKEFTTNAEGVAAISELPVGDHTYTLTSLPEGYSGEGTGTLTVTAAETATATISVEKAPVVGSASIKVIDQNESVVAGAVITLNEKEFTTNAEGVAAISELPVGDHTYTLTSLPEGYSGEGSGTLTVTAEESATATISVEKAPVVGSVSIKVIDQNEAVVAGAVVTIAEKEFTTNAEGLAAISDLPVGDHTYSLTSVPEGYSGEGSGTLTVTAEESATATISVTKAPTVGTATLTVVDQDGRKLEGVTLTINEKEFTTNAEGVAQATDLTVGEHSYHVTGLPTGYSGDVSGTVTVVAGETVAETVEVTRDPQYGNATITVKDQEDKAVVGAVIRLNEKDFTTNGEGQAVILELQAGKDYSYKLASLPEGYTGEAEGTITIAHDQTAEAAIAVNRTLAKGQLTVVVKDQTDTAVEGAVIQLAEGTEATTNAEGQVVFNDVAPKTYSVTIKQLPDRYSHELAAQEVVMTEGASETLALAVNRQITKRQINLRILDQEDQPVEKATIVLNEQALTTNAEGKVSLADLNPKTYSYEITGLPEGYQGAHEGELTLTEAEDLTQDIRVERIIEPGQATITVLDQNDQVVEGATVKFGGLSQATDNNGQTIFEDLEPGNYYYSVIEVPEAYTLVEATEEQRAEIAEAQAFEASLKVDKKPEVGRIDLKLVNSQNKPIANATVRIGEKEVATNEDGVASFTDLAPGDYSFSVTKAPEGYLLETTDARLTVEAKQTVTQTVVLQDEPTESSSEPASETSSESEESEADESEVAEATQRYVDDATGVEVLVNPADAGKVVKLQVTKVPQPLDPLPAALQNMNADVYEVVLLDRNNAPVQLTRVAQVKLPTQPVTSQLKVVRISGANTSTLTFSLFNQKVNFSTQELGRFAIVYGEKAVESESSSETSSQISSDATSESVSTSISVSKTTDVEANLPNTGEIRNVWLVALAVLLGLLGITLVVRKRGTNKQ